MYVNYECFLNKLISIIYNGKLEYTSVFLQKAWTHGLVVGLFGLWV